MSSFTWKSLRRSFERRLRRRRRSAPTESWWKTIRGKIKRRVRRFVSFDAPNWSHQRPPAVVQGQLSWRDYCNPWQWLRWTFSFVVTWITSRPYRKLAGALPALAAAGALSGLVTLAFVGDAGTRLGQYRHWFERAVDQGDYSKALTSIAALAEAAPGNAELLYQQAVVQDLAGDHDAANASMQLVARDHAHPMAALWLVSQHCDMEQIDSWTADQHQRFRTWMDIAMSGVDKNNSTAAKILMSTYLTKVGAHGDAIQYLKEIVPQRPEMALYAAKLSGAQDAQTAKERFVKIAESYYRGLMREQPSLAEPRIGLVHTLMLDERAEEAARLLNDGCRLNSDPRLPQMLGAVLAVWERQLAETDISDARLAERLKILHAAIEVAPNDAVVGQAIVQLLLRCRESSNPDVQRLTKAILNGRAMKSSDFIRGTLALLSNRFEEALPLLKSACEHPQVPGILNNFAVAISNTPGGNLQHALILSEEALSHHPRHAYFLETRGQVLMKMQRWDEAIEDLERALDAPELKPMIFPSLAKAYRSIGAGDRAERIDEQLRLLEH